MVGQRRPSKPPQCGCHQHCLARNVQSTARCLWDFNDKNMNIENLMPLPKHRESFKRSRCRFVPAGSGCYVLTTFLGVVLYVGLATSLRERMNQHLDDPQKTRETSKGRAVLF